MISKAGLGIILSRINGFSKPDVRVEQYETDAEIAATVLWQAKLHGDIGKVSADLGAGSGILGIGALLLGAKKVYFVENDSSAVDISKNNWAKIKSEYKVDGEAIFLCQDINEFDGKVDVVFQNPPFGTKVRHADKVFLEKAMKIAPIVYSFHKSETKAFIEGFCRANGFNVANIWDFKFPLKAKYEFHARKIHRINVSCFRILKEKSKKI